MAPPVCIQLLCVWICFPTCSAGNIELSVSNTEFFIFLPPKYSPLTLPLLVNTTLSLSATSFPLIYPNVRNFSSIICYPSLLLCFCCFSSPLLLLPPLRSGPREKRDTESVVPRPAASPAPGSLSEMHILGPHARPTESETSGAGPRIYALTGALTPESLRTMEVDHGISFLPGSHDLLVSAPVGCALWCQAWLLPEQPWSDPFPSHTSRGSWLGGLVTDSSSHYPGVNRPEFLCFVFLVCWANSDVAFFIL